MFSNALYSIGDSVGFILYGKGRLSQSSDNSSFDIMSQLDFTFYIVFSIEKSHPVLNCLK